MRVPLALATLGAAVAVSVLPAAPASAWCISLFEGETCMPCLSPDAAYQGLDETLGGVLPDREFPCVD